MESSYPFPPVTPGDLTDPGTVATADRWRRMGRWWTRTGVHYDDGAQLAVTAAPDALGVDLAAGSASVEGFLYENDATLRVLADPAAAALRYDRLVARMRLDPTTGSGRVRATYVAGVPGAGRPAALVRSATTYDLGLSSWQVAAGAGRVSAVGTEPGRFAGPELPQLAGPALPNPDEMGYPLRQGQRFTVTTGRWLDYVWDGTYWCIAPGQVFLDNAFWDGGGKHYGPTGWWRMGEARDGVAVGKESTLNFTLPRSLPGHGWQVDIQVSPYTAGNPHGELVAASLFSYSAPTGQIGTIMRMPAHGIYSSSYTNTLVGNNYFAHDDPQLGGETGARSWCVAGFCPTGYVQFWDGRLVMRSA